MVKSLACGIGVSEFELQSRYYVHFRTNTLKKGMDPLSSHLWVKEYRCCEKKKDGFGIKQLENVDMPLNNNVQNRQKKKLKRNSLFHVSLPLLNFTFDYDIGNCRAVTDSLYFSEINLLVLGCDTNW